MGRLRLFLVLFLFLASGYCFLCFLCVGDLGDPDDSISNSWLWGWLVGSILLFVAAIRQLLIFDREFPMPKERTSN